MKHGTFFITKGWILYCPQLDNTKKKILSINDYLYIRLVCLQQTANFISTFMYDFAFSPFFFRIFIFLLGATRSELEQARSRELLSTISWDFTVTWYISKYRKFWNRTGNDSYGPYNRKSWWTGPTRPETTRLGPTQPRRNGLWRVISQSVSTIRFWNLNTIWLPVLNFDI